MTMAVGRVAAAAPPPDGIDGPKPAIVLLVDERRLGRDILAAALERELPSSRVDAVPDVAGAVEYLQRRPKTDLVLVDSCIMREDGIKALHLIARAGRRARLVVLSANFDVDMAAALHEAGVHGAFSSNVGILELADKLGEIVRGAVIFDLPRPEDRRERLRKHFGLTEREFEIMDMIANGGRNGQIAGWLGISESTVRVHVSKIIRKLGVDTRMQAYDKWHKVEWSGKLAPTS